MAESLAAGEAIVDNEPSLSLVTYQETWEATEEVLGADNPKRFQVNPTKNVCVV